MCVRLRACGRRAAGSAAQAAEPLRAVPLVLSILAGALHQELCCVLTWGTLGDTIECSHGVLQATGRCCVEHAYSAEGLGVVFRTHTGCSRGVLCAALAAPQWLLPSASAAHRRPARDCNAHRFIIRRNSHCCAAAASWPPLRLTLHGWAHPEGSRRLPRRLFLCRGPIAKYVSDLLASMRDHPQ